MCLCVCSCKCMCVCLYVCVCVFVCVCVCDILSDLISCELFALTVNNDNSNPLVSKLFLLFCSSASNWVPSFYRVSCKKVHLLQNSLSQAPNFTQQQFTTRNNILFQELKFKIGFQRYYGNNTLFSFLRILLAHFSHFTNNKLF